MVIGEIFGAIKTVGSLFGGKKSEGTENNGKMVTAKLTNGTEIKGTSKEVSNTLKNLGQGNTESRSTFSAPQIPNFNISLR